MGTVAEEQARLAALENEGPAIPHQQYDPKGNYIPMSGTGTWGLGTSRGGAGSKDDGSFRETWTPTQDKPELGPVEQTNLPEMGELPTMATPEMGELPTYERPEWDEGEITRLSQVRGAAGVRNLRDAVQTLSRERYENPNVRRMSLRDAMKGYGEGLEQVMSGAHEKASSEYGQKYAYEAQEKQINYNTAVQAVRDIYSADLNVESANFQAQVAAIHQVYGAEVAAEMTRVAETNTQNRIIFDASMADYFKTGVTERTTGAGAGGGGVGNVGGMTHLSFRQKAYDALKANVSQINPYYENFMHSLGTAQLAGGRPTV